MVRFTYSFYDQIAEIFLAELVLKEPKWIEAVNGSGTFEAKVVIPEDKDQRDLIRSAVRQNNSIIVTADNGVQPWSGFIVKRKWDPATNELTITAAEWRTWLYRFIVAPFDNDPVGNDWEWEGTEQLEIAAWLIEYQVGEFYGSGVPFIAVEPYTPSGIERDLFVSGAKFRTLGSWMDSLANRDRGFEWDIAAQDEGAGPQLVFRPYYPQRGSVVQGLSFSYGTTGNILTYEPPEESSEEYVTRQWALGDGPNSEMQPYAKDEDPALDNDAAMRFDKVTSWQGVSDDLVLASHARAERRFYSKALDMLQFTVSMNSPHAYSYAVGDRCALEVHDRWLDLSYEKVRIIQRDIFPDQQVMKLTVDLSDDELPEVDDEGSV